MKSILALIKEKITQYIDVYVKLMKIGFIEGTSNILSYFMFAFICLFLVFCLLIFLGLGLTEIFVDCGLSRAGSLFITIGIYVLLLLFTVLQRKRITRFFAGGFIGLMTGGDEKNEEEKNEDDEK